MATWPASLQQTPNTQGFNVSAKDNVIRSSMEYGPDKIRQRSKNVWYDVQIQIWCDYTQLNTFKQFWEDNQALTWDWLDFLSDPYAAANYRFVGQPTYVPLNSHSHFQVSFSAEYELV